MVTRSVKGHVYRIHPTIPQSTEEIDPWTTTTVGPKDFGKKMRQQILKTQREEIGRRHERNLKGHKLTLDWTTGHLP